MTDILAGRQSDSSASRIVPQLPDQRQHATGYPWLFSPGWDLFAFGGSALISIGLLIVGVGLGLLDRDIPEWTWITTILLIDVAHVYSTAFRTYFNPRELSRRPLLYAGVPLASWILGTAIYSESPNLFWRCLAYLAVFHFVRQQYGWVALYRRVGNEPAGKGKAIDTVAIYAATLYPLLYWHLSLPRNFNWFVAGDFVMLSLPGLPFVQLMLAILYWSSMGCYAFRAISDWRTGTRNPGKHLVVATTALCWYVGIISLNSDYAFTVTNVLIHGIPYIVLVYWIGKTDATSQARPGAATRLTWGLRLLATVWLLAFIEELLWDRTAWQDRDWLFGDQFNLSAAQAILVPLLAVPQLTHYILDGFIWKRSETADLRIGYGSAGDRTAGQPTAA